MVRSRKEEEKNYNIYFAVRRERKDEREREREKEQWMKHLFSLPLSYHTVYVVDLQSRWIIQQP
jgi:hypothetical protein